MKLYVIYQQNINKMRMEGNIYQRRALKKLNNEIGIDHRVSGIDKDIFIQFSMAIDYKI